MDSFSFGYGRLTELRTAGSSPSGWATKGETAGLTTLAIDVVQLAFQNAVGGE